MSTIRSSTVATLAWTLLFVVVIDIAINLCFPMPASNQVEPSMLQRYFDYGRTVESKLHRMVGRDDADAAPIVRAGWLDRECTQPIAASGPQATGVSSYGMSFSNHVGAAMEAVDPSIRVAFRAGPSASVNHSYACFHMLHDARRDPNPIQVIGVLASSLNRMLTLTALTTSFEVPMPYTYPRYRVGPDGTLGEETPLVHSTDQLRDPIAMQAFFEQLAHGDALFDRWLMIADIGDHSSLVRIVRRAYAQHRGGSRASEWAVPAAHGGNDAEIGDVVSALLLRFATESRAAGQSPIVLLIQDRPGKDELFRLLAPRLRQNDIPFLSTHDIVPTSNPANFLADSHFTPAGDRLVAVKLLAMIREQQKLPR